MYSIYQLQAILDKAEVWIARNWEQQIQQNNRNLKQRCYDIFQLKTGLEWHLSGACTIDDSFTQKAFMQLNSYITPIGDEDISVVYGWISATCDACDNLYIIDNNFSFLKGDKGDTGPTGANGTNGTNGTNGESAYEVWLSLGNTGNEQDFINSLKGSNGSQGAQGVQGIKGDKGDKGDTGPQGPAGSSVTGVPLHVAMEYHGPLSHFDATGLGINANVIGWALCNGNNGTRNRMGRIGIPYTPTDPDFGTVTQTGGARQYTLLRGDLPAEKLYVASVNVQSAQGKNLYLQPNKAMAWSSDRSSGNQDYDLKYADSGDANIGTTSRMGDGNAFGILNPYEVILLIERIA